MGNLGEIYIYIVSIKNVLRRQNFDGKPVIGNRTTTTTTTIVRPVFS